MILFDGDTFEYRGHTFKITIERDDDLGPPWKEHDGHGPVSEWTTRDKAPGERVLCGDRRSKRYYDYRGAIAIAKRDGWGCSHTMVHEVDGKRIVWQGHTTKGKCAACAVDHDYAHLRAWCNDDWYWTQIIVKHIDSGETESVGGIEDPDGSYTPTLANELANEILSRVEVDDPDVQVSEN